jgi:probable addiction module antidote protein
MTEKMTTRPFDMANYLHSEEEIAEYLKFAFESGDERKISRALATATKAKGMLQTSKKTGLNRSSLYKTLINNDGLPSIGTVNKLVRSFGCYLSVVPANSRLTAA